jgi:ATP adenylyltransferase
MDRMYAPWRSQYFTMDRGGECLFCSLRRESEDRRVGILHRGEHWYVVLNAFPYTNGHIMIVPNRHVAAIGEITADEGAELVALLARCERAIDEAYAPDGVNIGINRGASAGAGIVDHIHVHMLPRWTGDTNFMTALAETRVVSEDLDASWQRLRPRFG